MFTIFYALLTASLFSSFIYMEYFFDITSIYLNTFTGLFALYLIFNAKKKQLFWIGFFIGLLWFYWVGFSMRYYQLSYLIPFVILFFSFAYALFFHFASFLHPLLRAGYLVLLSYIEPFGWNWFKPEIMFDNSLLKSDLLSFFYINIILALFVTISHRIKIVVLLFLLLLYQPHSLKKEKPLPFSMEIVQSNVDQDLKWEDSYLPTLVKDNLELIKNAITKKKKLILFPESAFALYLNEQPLLLKTLKHLSHSIIIITGALYVDEKDNYFNVTYKFENGSYTISKKMILVPFGEYIPLPAAIRDFINRIFFNGVEDYTPALKAGSFTINNVLYGNAICYEATSKEIYTNPPPFIFASSNNKWFTPSIEPTLQHLLIYHYVKLYHTSVIHSVNGSKSEIISE